MALDKAIEHKKEHRKMYRGSKAIDASCRNHGGCDWCLENRTYKYKKKKEAARLKEEEFEQEMQRRNSRQGIRCSYLNGAALQKL